MLALILAGGEGKRLGMGEKPLVSICGRPMIAFVIDAFTAAGLEVMVVASRRTPMTVNYLRAQGIPFLRAGGKGYMEDIIEAVTEVGVRTPHFTSVADIPCLRPDHITRIRTTYRSSGPAGPLHLGTPRPLPRGWVQGTLYRDGGGRALGPRRGEYPHG